MMSEKTEELIKQVIELLPEGLKKSCRENYDEEVLIMALKSATCISNEKTEKEVNLFLYRCEIAVQYTFDKFQYAYKGHRLMADTKFAYHCTLAAFAVLDVDLDRIKEYKIKGFAIKNLTESIDLIVDYKNRFRNKKEEGDNKYKLDEGKIKSSLLNNEFGIYFNGFDSIKSCFEDFVCNLESRINTKIEVAEFILKEMKSCSIRTHRSCKFECHYMCENISAIRLIADQVDQYNIIRIDEYLDSEGFSITSFVYVIREAQDILSVVMCSSSPIRTSVYKFLIHKDWYYETLFIIVKYFESRMSSKRKYFNDNFDRFGKHFGVLHYQTYRS